MPKVSDAHRRAVRQKIIDAAYGIIEAGDFSGLTTRLIAQAAGVSNGTLYHYFPSIDHLYVELAEASLRTAMAGIVQPETGTGDEVAELQRWLRVGFLGDRELAAAFSRFRDRVEPDGATSEVIDELNQFAFAQFGDLIRHLQSRGRFRADLDAEALVEMIDFLWDGLGRRQAAGAFRVDYDRVVDTIVDVIMRGVLVPTDR